jgi:dTMP kinase
MTGKLITFEGIDGAGKGSQYDLLYNYLIEEDFNVVKTREPGGTPFADKLRDILKYGPSDRNALSELFAFESARADLVQKKILPALRKEWIVLADRYSDSSLSYQGYGRGLELNLIRNLNEIATDGLVPDLTLLFDVELNEAHSTDQAVFERLGSEYMKRVREGYLELARENPERIKIIKRMETSGDKERSIRKTFYEGTLEEVMKVLNN